jgi:Protein of unknown function (DUF1217)
VLPTYTSYNQINKDLTKSLARTAKQTDVQRDTDYYNKHIGDIKSIDAFMKNDRIYRYAMKAYGLEDMIFAKAMIRKVLEGGIEDEKSYANKLTDPRFKALAKAFDFKALGAATTATEAAQKQTVDAFVRQKLEANAGDQNEGVRLALYFQRKASSVTSPYGILADKALLKVYQTAFDVSPLTSAQSIETQAATVKKLLDIKDLQDPKKIEKIIQKFTAKYDIANAGATGAYDPVATLWQNMSSNSPVSIGTDIYNSLFNLKLGG